MKKKTTVYWSMWGCGFVKDFSSRKAAKQFVRDLGLRRQYVIV